MIASVHNLPAISPLFNPPSSEKKAASPIVLEPPSTLTREQRSIFEISVRGHTLSEQYIRQLTDECALKMEEIQELQKKKLEALRTQAELAQTSSSWQTLQTVASYLVSAFNILAGVLSLGAAPIAAGVCLAIGILSLANTIFAQLEGYDWIAEKLSNGDKEKEIRLKTVLPMVVNLLLLGANLGSVALLGIQGMMQLSSSLMRGCMAAPQFIQGGSQMMKGVYDGKILQESGRLVALSFQLQKLQHSVGVMTHTSIEDTKMTNRMQQALLDITALKNEVDGYFLRLR